MDERSCLVLRAWFLVVLVLRAWGETPEVPSHETPLRCNAAGMLRGTMGTYQAPGAVHRGTS